MTGDEGDHNTLQGDFGESWLELIASGLRLDHGRPGTTDLDKADVEVTLRGEHWGTYSPTVKAQVKTVTGLRDLGEDTVAYDLDVGTYNVLRLTNHATRRVLVVVHLRDDAQWMSVSDEETRLLGRGYWVSLEGKPASGNAATVAVHLPRRNTLDEEGMMRMLRECGVRRSSIVPDYEAWGDDE